MTETRELLHRWAVLLYAFVTLSAAALRSFRRARHRRRARLEVWPW